MAARLEAALKHQRAITVVSLLVMTLMAWGWLVAGAGTGMPPLVSLTPSASGGHDSQMAMGAAPVWSVGLATVTFFMWWVMMVAMMLPSATPVVLLSARVASRSGRTARPATEAFVAGYLASWGGFSLLATALQLVLVRAALAHGLGIDQVLAHHHVVAAGRSLPAQPTEGSVLAALPQPGPIPEPQL
jgi:predicted metal-binding membrane protein